MGPSDAEFKTLVAQQLGALRLRIEALEAEVANLKASPPRQLPHTYGKPPGGSGVGRAS